MQAGTSSVLPHVGRITYGVEGDGWQIYHQAESGVSKRYAAVLGEQRVEPVALPVGEVDHVKGPFLQPEHGLWAIACMSEVAGTT